jgi:hypothetical protein
MDKPGKLMILSVIYHGQNLTELYYLFLHVIGGGGGGRKICCAV